jgi:hypothetical protein
MGRLADVRRDERTPAGGHLAEFGAQYCLPLGLAPFADGRDQGAVRCWRTGRPRLSGDGDATRVQGGARALHVHQAAAKRGLERRPGASRGEPQPSPNTGLELGRCTTVRVGRGGVEPPTFRFSGGRSYRLSYLPATPTGLEPATSAVTGRRANQLRYGARHGRAGPRNDGTRPGAPVPARAAPRSGSATGQATLPMPHPWSAERFRCGRRGQAGWGRASRPGPGPVAA